MACPVPDRLQALVAGTLAEDEREAIARHADDCDACRAAMVELFRIARERPPEPATLPGSGSDPATDETVGASSDPATDATAVSGVPVAVAAEQRALAAGTVVDRYVVEARLGAGAMGVVYAARDPELDRRVALKLLRHGRNDEALRARLLREAQALAKVDHANVVSVYDVGTHDDKVFVAMELVRGTTLRTWLATPRPWREALAMVVAAGRGLAAAHAAGLVHRDVKPDNILVGDDGVARVTDFGLARATAGPADADDVRAGSDPVTSGSPLGSNLTATGSLLGTPVYAPPEQLLGKTAGPLADQFSFCVTAYEAVYGHRPFDAATLGELISAIERGALVPPPPDRRVPGRIHRAIVRGLAATPERRFGAMDELLRELAPRPRRWPWIAAAAAGALGITVVVVVALGGATAQARCRSADNRLAGVWDAARRGEVTAAFAALPGYVEAGPKLVAHLDGYTDAWRGGWRDACTATEQSSTMFDLRIACLDRRRVELAAVAKVLTTIDRSAAAEVQELLGSLGSIPACADAVALAASPAPAPAQRAAVDQIEAAIADAAAAVRVRRLAEARTLIEPAVATARKLGFAPLLARALLSLGTVEQQSDRLAESEAALRESSSTALAANDRELTARALMYLAHTRSTQGDVEGATDSLELAAGSITALGDQASTDIKYSYAFTVAAVRATQGKVVEALAAVDEAMAMVEHDRPVDVLRLAMGLTNRGQLLTSLGRFTEAAQSLDRALTLMTGLLGPDHPNVASIRASIALILAQQHRYTEAIAMIQQAYGVLRETLGPEAAATLDVESNLGGIALELGDYPDALAHYQHVVAAASAVDPRGTQALIARIAVAETLNRMGKSADAVDQLVAVRADAAATLGAEAPMLALVDLFLAGARLELGQLAEAEAVYDRTAKTFGTSFGTEITEYGQAVSGRGRARLALGRVALALADLRAARAVFAKVDEPYRQARNELAIADALWRTDDHDGARAAAVAAIAALDALSPTANPAVRTEIAAWQRAHP